MTEPAHHAPDAMLAAYAADALPYPFAVVTAAHVSLCDECRARLDAHRILGGLVLDDLTPETISPGTRDRALAALELKLEATDSPTGHGPYPVPIQGFVGPTGPRWQSLGFGAKQAVLWSGAAGSLRLLSIPAARAVPEHGHRGLELTMVLLGAFADETGLFQSGDLEVADEEVGHTPRATEEGPCVCVAATDAPLRFRAVIPRLLQPIFRI
jgi:putative transcriptional regulator